MAYQMTPSERRARALALKQQRENRNLYQQYLTQKEEYDRRVEQERLNALYEENKVKNQNFFVRAGHTIGDIAANVITGAVKGLEGIYDLGAGIVGAVGGIFDKGFQDDVKKHISYDWTMETFGNDWQEALKYSYTKNGGIVESVASGIGQMLPSVAVTIATGGAGAPAAVSQMASLATLGASAAGNATEEAFNDGAGYYAGLGYGLASGAVEMATEKMFGGATKGLFGKGMLDEVGKSIADTGIKRIAKNALEEGVEEMVSEAVNPLLKSIYKGKDAFTEQTFGEYVGGVAKAGLIGSLTSLAYTGTVGYGLSKVGVGYVGKEADINDSLAEIETQKKKAENLFANEKLTEQNESRISSNIVGNYQNIERTLKKASESKRASLIKQFSLEKAFNPDGSIKGDFATQIGLASNEAQVAQEGQQGSNEGLASQFKKEYYSPSLRGSEAMIQSDLAAMTERLRIDEKNFAEQQGREAQEIAEVKPFTGEMSETAKKNYTSLKKGLNALNGTSGGKIRLVVVDPHDSINGSITTEGTFYISESQLESGAWAETLVHEYTHFAEGSKEYGKLLGFLQSDDILVEGVEGQSIPLWQKAQEAVIHNYGFDQKRLESIVERVRKNETLSPEDTVYYNAYLSELGAHESEYLLGNEAFIDKIIRKDKSLAAKIIDKIHNLKSMFEKTNDTRTRKEQRLINKAEKLWLNSVEKAGLKYSGGKIYRRREVDAKAQNEYNGEVAEVSLSRKVAKYIPYTKIGVENVRSIRSEINNLYSGIDNGVADGIALVREKTIYILDTGKDNGEVRFGFRKAITISDDERRSRYAQHINEEAANDGFGNREIYARLGVELGNDSGSNVGRELQQNTQNSQRESKNIKDRPLKNDRNRRVQEVKFSRTSQDLINSQMSMETCRDMLQRTFKLVNPNQYEESIRWRTADEWLADIGVEEAALYIDNEYEITRRFFSEKKTPGVYNGDVYTEQILEAYLNKTLTGEKIIEKPTRLSLSESNGYIDKRFYSPKAISEAKSKLEVASQKITNQNRSEVQQARADILLFAHQKGAAELLGITQAELNKKLLSWAHYPAKAKEISTKLNEGVALENKWVGLENSSYMVSAMVDEESMRRLVKDIVGRSTELERSYITNTMLALDTHIDYSQLTFEFGAGNEQLGRSSVRGEYRDSERKIYVRGGAYQNTVAHEIGHAIDHQWAREIFGENSTYALSDSYDRVLDKLSPDKAQFVKNFRIFIESIMDSGDISSEYTQRANETFARFVARFVEWTKSVATGRYNHIESSFYSDKFTASQYLEFVRLLQEKAKIDSERLVESEKQKGKNIKFSRKNDNVYHFINKLAKIEISWNEESDTYHLYCENAKGYLEYEGTLTEDEIESRFGDELGLDLEQKAWEKDGGVATLDRSWIEYYADEIKPQEKYDDDYLTEAKEQYGTTDNVLLAGYINTDGSMLDFSGGYESRFIDHSEIDTIFDEESGVDAMYAYMRMGNIRLMPEAPSLEFNSGVEPTSQQYDTIKKAIDILIEKNGKFFIEFSSNEGDSVTNRRYERGVSTKKIISDIQYFYEHKELPHQSDLAQFRFSRKRTPVEEMHRTYYKLSDGQIKKLLANNTHYKVYSKVDAERIINNILSQYMSFGEKYGEINGKTKTEVVDMLWKGLNSAEPGKQMGVALHIADYIIQNSVLESIYADDDVQVQAAIDIIDALRPYLHSINLDSIKGEIKYKYDRDNSAYLLWGKRKGESGMGVDQIARILEENGIHFDAINEADIFFEIDAQYRNAVKSLKKKAKDMLSASLSKDQIKELRQEIAREVLRGFDYTGKSSKLAEVLDKYKKQISTLYEKLRDSNRHNKATNRLLDKVQKIKNWKTGAFVNSSKFRSKLFKGSIERLAMIKNRGNLNQSGTRRILAGLAEWYAKDNPILGYVDENNGGIYNQEIANILQAVAQNQKPLTDEQVDLISVLQEKSGITDYKGLLEWYTKANLGKGYSAEVKSLLRELASETTFTTEEIIALEKVVSYFGNLIENYNKVIRNGKYVDAKPIAEGYIETIKRNKGVKVGWFSKFFDKVFNNGKASYLQTFADPMTVARYMDKYENGFYSDMLAELRAGGIKASVLEVNIRQPLEEFLSKHKKYGRGVSQRTIKYKGIELPALDAFLLYMTMNREQALGGLAEAGFTFNNGKETIRVDGFAKGEELTLAELRERAKAEQDELYKQFTEEDREYISIAEKIFNEDCREAKVETDLLRQGYSNVAGYYVPIDRANSAKTVDSSNFFDEGNRVSNASFNKDTVQGAKGELFIEGLDEVLDRHIHGISLYAGLATVIDQYDILYNLNMSEDANKPITVRTESENTWAKGNDYFKKLISDLQGISPTRGGGSKLFGFFRGHYATYQLGLNPKVWFTQLSSFFASGSVLDYSSILKGLSINAKDVDEYCQLAAVRNNDNSAAMAQGVMDKVDKVGSALMKPIGMVDRFVVKKLFGACQVQVEKESGLKVGTEENKKKAGELLEKVIVETQQNSMATERSAAMRSGSELMKTLTMFTADSMKVFGRVVDSLGEVSVLKAKIKETTDSKVKAELEEKLKAAKKKSVKSVAALATTAIFMALIAQAFRWLYNKDDEDENIPANMAVDAIGNLMGGLPLIKDLYAKLTEGYDLNNYSYSALNDLFDAFSGTISTVTSLAKGEEVKPLRTVKELSYAVGQILGLPTRNVYNIIYGLTKRISPSTAYGWDSNLYNKNYATDLQKAINNDDDEMLATIVGLMLNEKVGGIDNSLAREEMDRLVKGGYQVLPKSIGNTITYEGEEVEITSKQRERFKKVYGEANKALASLVNDKSYASANDEVKAKAVRFIYDIYYNLAIEDLLGVDLETKNILFAKAIDISSLAIIVATARSLEADTDKKGNIISGSRKKKVQTYINSLRLKAAQKYMIMGYLGNSNKYGQQQVKSYIQRLSLTKSEKEKLYEYSGYAT